MFQYGETVLVRPVVYYFAHKEDGDVILPCRLGRKKVVRFEDQISVVPALPVGEWR